MQQLRSKLERMDGRGYKAYKEIQGEYLGNFFSLYIDYVQPDPFANPSRLRLELSSEAVGLEEAWSSTHHRRVALEDYIARIVAQGIHNAHMSPGGTGKSGLVYIDGPGQEILERTAVRVAETVEIRLSLGLPARGRRVLGRQAYELLGQKIPELIRRTVLALDRQAVEAHLTLADEQQAIRSALSEQGLVAFVANGAILPRQSGVSNRPLTNGAIPFQSPPSLEVEISLPRGKSIKGMGIPQGVTLIVGGGYHGKSTLLKAVERGVYNHVAGDGREYVITEPSAMKIRAEDGRSIKKVNISPFINRLPGKVDTTVFSSQDGSGSTSQAANIIEALEVGSKLLLIDEDTSATNFMIRDARMQALVAKDKEPITPFVDKVQQLYRDIGVSTVLVVGGSGDYLDVADTVIMMDEYHPREVTEAALAVAQRFPSVRTAEGGGRFGPLTPRRVLRSSLDSTRRGREKISAKGLDTIVFGRQSINLAAVEQLVDASQTRALAEMLRFLVGRGDAQLTEMVDEVFNRIEQGGLEAISPYRNQHPGDLALPRRQEMAAALNRLRNLGIVN